MASPLAEADLHNLVDGRIDADRRADLLRRLAGSPSDRALVESWQEQTEIIRTAFRDIEHEPLPVALNLAPPRLRCVENDPLRPIGRTGGGSRRGGVVASATALVVVGGLAASWWAIGQGDRDGIGANATPVPVDAAALADRATAALASESSAAPGGAGLPTLRIPDLSATGLRLVDVSTPAEEPATIVLLYRDDGQGRVSISAARAAPGAGPAPPTPLRATLTWRRRDAVFAIAGTLPPARLRAIAASLQDDQGRE